MIFGDLRKSAGKSNRCVKVLELEPSRLSAFGDPLTIGPENTKHRVTPAFC
jgi:hypothetical protein